MNYLKTILCLGCLFVISTSSTKKITTKTLKGNYNWQYTMTENEIMLTRDTSHSRFGDLISFSGSKFIEKRSGKCGNDIFYNKTGTYYMTSSKFILNYTGGTFSDNVGGDSMEVYVKGKVYFDVKRISKDTIFLFRTKGLSTKKVVRK
jgi:hypothetical protein